jgi:hypothetical protein
MRRRQNNDYLDLFVRRNVLPNLLRMGTMQHNKKWRGMQQGGLYEYLYGDEEEDTYKEGPTAPSESEVVEEQQPQQDDGMAGRRQMAMDIASEDYTTTFGPTGRSRYRGSAGNGPALESNQRAEYAYNYYRSRGLPEHISAGIVGNLVHESGMATTAKGDAGKATGLAQWHPDRFKVLQKWATSNGRNPYDINTQLDFVLAEPGEGERVMSALQKTKTVDEAARVFSDV